MIVNEAFWTAFGRLSDIFLPATTSLEPNDLGATSRYRFIIAMKQAIAPVGEACNDFDAFSDLAERFELRDLFTEMEWVRYLYDTASEQASKRGLRWDDFVVRAFNNRGAILAGAVISDQIRRKMGGMSGCTKPCRPKPQLHPPPFLVQQQRRFDYFRHQFNRQRPHETIGQTPPHQHYSPSPRGYPVRLEDPVYPPDYQVRRVRGNGGIKWAGETIFLSMPLIGEVIGVKCNERSLPVIILRSASPRAICRRPTSAHGPICRSKPYPRLDLIRWR